MPFIPLFFHPFIPLSLHPIPAGSARGWGGGSSSSAWLLQVARAAREMPWESARSTRSSSRATAGGLQPRAGPIHLTRSWCPLPTTAAARCRTWRCVWSRALPSRRGRDKRHQLSVFLCFSSARAVYHKHCLGLHLPPGSSPDGAAEHPAHPRRHGVNLTQLFGYGNADLLHLPPKTPPACFL